ncbi:unnamed protein product [Effrenium voratum]|nr:unnamed protein product [Effrenium voratum]
MAGRQKAFARGGTKSLCTQKSLRLPEGDLDLFDVLGTEPSKSVPLADVTGRRSPRLPPLERASLKGSKEKVAACDTELGRYRTPSMSGKSTKRRSSMPDVGKDTRGVMSPVPPAKTPGDLRPCPVRRRACSVVETALDTSQLGAILRRKSGDIPEVARAESKDSVDDSEELPQMAMTKAKTDAGVMRTRPPVSAATQAEAEKVTDHQRAMLELLLSDQPEHKERKGEAAQATQDAGSLSDKQRKQLDRRRRSRELQALLNEDADDSAPAALLNEAAFPDATPASKDDQYWDSMWQLSKTARLAAETEDTEADGLHMFEHVEVAPPL